MPCKVKQLPFDGGFDGDGNLTRDPKAILKKQQSLPIGFWKARDFRSCWI